ncbi:MAG TPA: LPS export ABC transporter periplasmic protein LptC [Candidatus Eisenbacteria bacterium]|nr:LPS export ABC transporter periplasmic protein LptC [Candidatus Eisenbacteria bacterium]
MFHALSPRSAPWWRAGCVMAMVALMALGCEKAPRTEPGPASGEMPDQEVSDFVVTETDAGQPQWTLYARSAAIYNARNAIVAHGVRVDFFDEEGKRSSTLTAREGELNQQRRDMVARGNVVLQTTEGTRMSTEELSFINQRQRIVSDLFVRVERAGDVLTGIGFESDPNLEHFEFKKQVQATVRTRSGGILEEGK